MVINWTRVLVLTLIFSTILATFGAAKVDGITFCFPPSKSISFIHPNLDGLQRELTDVHEAKHRWQVSHYGCVDMMMLRLSKRGRYLIELEALMAEVEYLTRKPVQWETNQPSITINF